MVSRVLEAYLKLKIQLTWRNDSSDIVWRMNRGGEMTSGSRVEKERRLKCSRPSNYVGKDRTSWWGAIGIWKSLRLKGTEVRSRIDSTPESDSWHEWKDAVDSSLSLILYKLIIWDHDGKQEKKFWREKQGFAYDRFYLSWYWMKFGGWNWKRIAMFCCKFFIKCIYIT